MRSSKQTIAVARTGAGVGLVLVALVAGCAKKQPPALTEVVAQRVAALPASPDDPAWKKVPAFTAPLILQDMVEPRLLVASTPAVDVQALTDGSQVSFRLTWTDSTMNDLPGAARFTYLPKPPTGPSAVQCLDAHTGGRSTVGGDDDGVRPDRSHCRGRAHARPVAARRRRDGRVRDDPARMP